MNHTTAWLIARKRTPLEVKPIPYTFPTENEIVTKKAAVTHQSFRLEAQKLARFPLKYSAILGLDQARSKRKAALFFVSPRVIASWASLNICAPRGTLRVIQEHTVVAAHMASQSPASLSFERVAIIPLVLSTVGAALS